MANEAALLLSSYAELVALFERQIVIADQARYDEQLDQIQELEQQKGSFQTVIEQISTNETFYNDLTESEREAIISYIQQLEQLNERLQQIILRWYSDNSKEMKQVSAQRKTLQGYGGVNNSDVISYYFDKKQ